MKYSAVIFSLIFLAGCFTRQHIPNQDDEFEYLHPELQFNTNEFKVIYRKGIYSEPDRIVNKTEITIGDGNFGQIKYSPCISSISFARGCEEDLFITESDLQNLHDLFIRYELYEKEWQIREFIFDGDIYEEAIFEINGFRYIIPPYLEFELIVAEEVFNRIREIVPDGTWMHIKEERKEYYKNVKDRYR